LVGWFTPGLGVLNIIPGGIFSGSYDKRATALFIDKAEPSYKSYVSNKIVAQINDARTNVASNSKLHYKMETVVLDDETTSSYSSSAKDNRFAIYIGRVEDGRVIPSLHRVKVLPEETLEMLEKISKKERIVDSDNVRDVLLSFGINDVSFPNNLNAVNIYTMQDDKLVALFQGRKSNVKLARK
jgi:hypothetical protein